MKNKYFAVTALMLCLCIFQTTAIGDGFFPSQNEAPLDNATYRPNDSKGIEVYKLSMDEAVRLAYKAAQAAGYDEVVFDEMAGSVVIHNESLFMGGAKGWIQPILVKNLDTDETGVFFETRAQGVGLNFSLIPSYVIGGYKTKFDHFVKQDGVVLEKFTRYEKIKESVALKPSRKSEIAQGSGLDGHALPMFSGFCNVAWDAEKLMQVGSENSLDYLLQLRNSNSKPSESISVSQLQAFYEANKRISNIANLSPKFIICDGKQPNAFATSIKGDLLVGVTLGMLKLVDGDRDMAAIVIGHEYTHHIKQHRLQAQARNNILGLLGLVVGSVLENKLNKKYQGSNIGLELGKVGASLISSKFDRDQEREADTEGLNYLMKAGFSPAGASRLSDKMNKLGGGAGLFFDTHPGWDERSNRFSTLISQSAEAKQLLANLGEFTHFAEIGNSSKASSETKISKNAEISLLPTYEATDAEKSLNDALLALARNNLPEGVRHLRAAAEAGNSLAQSGLGFAYIYGKGGLQKDLNEALRLFRLSAEQGDAHGQSNLGVMYMEGLGLEKDYAEALRLLRLSAEQGYGFGQANLGSLYARGFGVSKDYDEAIKWFRLSTDQGNSAGQYSLGVMYLNGFGVNKDYIEAARLFRLSADRGLASAQNNLGSMYMNGLGVKKDLVEAARLFQLAAEQDNPQGQANYGLALLNGAGIRRNKEEAINWLLKASAQGHPQAITTLKKLGISPAEVQTAKVNAVIDLPQPSKPSTKEEKLEDIKKLFDDGLISEQIYLEKQREVLDTGN